MNKIISPVITEKSMNEASKGKFTFRVTKEATKTEIKKEIEERFKVNVTNMSSMNIKGRSLRAGKRRNEIALTPFKKVVAQLKSGQKIALFDIGGKE